MDQLKRARVDGGREVIVVDRGEDAKLRAFMSTVTTALNNITDERARANRLAVLVADRLGGVRADIVAACEADVARVGTKVVPIGELRVGICRHRALLYNYCADHTG
jgi:hypothetical protein